MGEQQAYNTLFHRPELYSSIGITGVSQFDCRGSIGIGAKHCRSSGVCKYMGFYSVFSIVQVFIRGSAGTLEAFIIFLWRGSVHDFWGLGSTPVCPGQASNGAAV